MNTYRVFEKKSNQKYIAYLFDEINPDFLIFYNDRGSICDINSIEKQIIYILEMQQRSCLDYDTKKQNAYYM